MRISDWSSDVCSSNLSGPDPTAATNPDRPTAKGVSAAYRQLRRQNLESGRRLRPTGTRRGGTLSAPAPGSGRADGAVLRRILGASQATGYRHSFQAAPRYGVAGGRSFLADRKSVV